MVGSAGTHQPESRSQACRRACPAHDAGVHLRPRLGPANSRSAVRVRGRRAVVKDVGVRPPNDGPRRPRTDDARPRPPENATPAAVHVVRVVGTIFEVLRHEYVFKTRRMSSSAGVRDKIRLLGFTTLHDSRRYAIPRCLDPSHPDTKARCTGDDEYAPTNLGTRPGRRCWTAVRNRR